MDVRAAPDARRAIDVHPRHQPTLHSGLSVNTKGGSVAETKREEQAEPVSQGQHENTVVNFFQNKLLTCPVSFLSKRTANIKVLFHSHY